MAVSMSAVSHSTKRMKLPSNIMPGMRRRCDARMRIRRRKRRVREETTMVKVKSLRRTVSFLRVFFGLRLSYQGIPMRICCWTVINQANIPRFVAAAAKMINIHRFSWTSGQW
jgi:hypothetical protein